VVRIAEPEDNERVMNLPSGSLASEVALVSADASQACFDVKVRTWAGALPDWEVALLVDGRSVHTEKVHLRACTKESVGPDDSLPLSLSCVPVDSAVADRGTDSADSVQVRGDRLCLDHGGALMESTSSVSLAIAQGAKALEFSWTFAGAADPRR
jgi:hypothetical protein